jgi:hypothetical protein
MKAEMTIDQFLEALAGCGLKFEWFEYCGTKRIRTVELQVPHYDGSRLIPYQFCPICAVAYRRNPASAPRNHMYTDVGMGILGLSQIDAYKTARAADGEAGADPELRAKLIAVCRLAESKKGDPCDDTK